MRFRILICCVCMLLICLCSSALADEASFAFVPDILHPGKAERISFSLPADGEITLSVQDASGNTVQTIRQNMSVSQGIVNLSYNGCDIYGNAMPQGEYTLVLTHNSVTVSHPLTIGAIAPQITQATLSSAMLGESFTFDISCNTAGTLNVFLILSDGTSALLQSASVQEGANTLHWDGLLNGQLPPAGNFALQFVLTDAAGFSGNARQLPFTLATPTPPPTPTPEPIIRISPDATESIPGDFWSMEIGNYDWAAIWDVMTAPITIINGRDQRETYKLRLTPDDSNDRDNIVGEVVFESQGVHVLETLDNGWSYVETYNASYGPNNYSPLRGNRGYGTTDELIRGYVKTSLLETITPSTEYGLLIDKKTQELYILTKDGLFTTLIISTGFPTKEQPWNETVAGEYFLCSKVGDFPAGNLTCGYGMRIAGGCLLHEVPYIYNEKYSIKDYSYTEKYLGEKASHGCVRVQRKRNEQDINMKWIWDNVPLKTKVLIWDDSGRPIDYPDDSMMLYFNPDGGKYYHDDQNCSSIKDRYLPLKGSFTYGELDMGDNARFTPCPYCDPPLRKAEIAAQNAANGF